MRFVIYRNDCAGTTTTTTTKIFAFINNNSVYMYNQYNTYCRRQEWKRRIILFNIIIIERTRYDGRVQNMYYYLR